MIDLYTWSTPNGRKVSIMLEETGLAYRVHKIDISKGDEFKPEFVALNPNSKIPAIVDGDGPGGRPLPLFESGAILIYLAEKTGKLLPKAPAARYTVLEWLMFQMGGVGPMFGQVHHFLRAAPEPVPYAIERYGKETRRLYGVPAWARGPAGPTPGIQSHFNLLRPLPLSKKKNRNFHPRCNQLANPPSRHRRRLAPSLS